MEPNKKILNAISGIALISFALVLLMGCAATETSYEGASVIDNLAVEDGQEFQRAYAPVEFDFPKDHGAHPEYRTEWWYFTGTLQDASGDQYGYQFTVFRTALTPHAAERQSTMATNQIYLAHFALTDAKSQDHVSFEQYSRGGGELSGASGEPSFGVWLENWSVTEQEPGIMRMTVSETSADGNEYALDLTLRETRQPVLHGDSGLSQKGPEPGNASYYYSLIGLETAGTITWLGNEEAVEGLSWMDHEYGSSALSKDAVGWDWFSVQLNTGDALMLAHIRTEDGGLVEEMLGTYVSPNGDTIPLSVSDYQIQVLDEWTSPQTDITYPSGWRVTVPELNMEIELSPIVKDQEMLVSFIYWEGAVSISGRIDDMPVSGTGYVELTGYGDETGDLRFQR